MLCLNSGVVCSYMSPATGPGLTALTVARSASSRLQVRVMASSAALEPPYSVWAWKPRLDETEERLTMRPDRSWGR